MDAGRTAIALIRAFRHGDYLSGFELAGTLNDEEKGHLVGALLALANQALNACEDLSTYGRTHGISEMTATADMVLSQLALGFATDGQMHD
jgi:hypothetical protein